MAVTHSIHPMAPSPLVALIATPSVESNAVSRGFKSISHLLFPFGQQDISIRDPITNQQLNSTVRLDVRDIANDGHLLSLTVLPHVLEQALRSTPDVTDAVKLFWKVLSRWAEPSEHESFGAYLACIFFVSSNDEAPMTELSKMIQTQQTLYNSSSTLMIPPYCCAPKWATAHSKTPKHYILLHDPTTGVSDQRRDEIINQMCTTYGRDNCQVFELSKQNEWSSVSQYWNDIDEMLDMLTQGLDRAMREASDTRVPTSSNNSYPQSPTSPSFVSTISSALPSVSIKFTGTNETIVPFRNREKRISQADVQSGFNLIKHFSTHCLIPFVENEIKSLNDLVGPKRGMLTKSITSGVKKWFTTGSSQSNLAVPASYSWDSPEMQLRRLADLSLLFGNPGFAYQQYRALKKDLEADQAMVAFAIATEMCAVACHMSQPNAKGSQFPIRYLESSISNLLNNGGKYTHSMRCAHNLSEIYNNISLTKEAADIMGKLVSLKDDYLIGVAHTVAASLTHKLWQKKSSFYRCLAAMRFSTAGISNLAFDSYRLALPQHGKYYGVIDEHLCLKLLEEGEKSGLMTNDMAKECVFRIAKVCPKLSSSLQTDRVDKIVRALEKYQQKVPFFIDVPRIDASSIKVIYGERPLWNEIDDDENKNITSDGWITIERAAHYSMFGATTPFRGMQMVSDAHSDNQKPRETPAGERYRVMIDLQNPLSVPINLRNIRLGVTNVEGDKSDNMEVGVLPHLTIDANEIKTVELYVFPKIGCLRFRVDRLLYQLCSDSSNVEVQSPLDIKGKRLNKTAKQLKSKTYAVDERLSAVVSQKSWPLVEFKVLKSPSEWSFCDQAMRYQIEIENIGQEDVVSMSLATDAFDRVAAGVIASNDVRIDIEGVIAANNNKIATFKFENPTKTEAFLKVGEKKKIFFDLRAGDQPSEDNSIVSSKQKCQSTVILIAYHGVNGSVREWRKVVDGQRKKLLGVETKVLDEDNRIFSLIVRNCLPMSQAALSRIQIVRMRCTKNGEQVSTGRLEMINTRKIEIESEQNDTLVVRFDASSPSSSDFWLSPASETTNAPRWPCPAVTESYDDPIRKITNKIGILWKSNVVNNDGHVSTIIGETFIDDPFEKTIIDKENDGKVSLALPKLRISCATLKNITHDFKSNKICELPVNIKIRNLDNQTVDVSVRFVSKIRDPVDGIHLIAPETRQQMWIDRPVRRAKLGPNEMKELSMKMRVSHASVYDVGGNNLSIEASFDNTDEKTVFKVPSVLSVVKAI